MAKTLNQHQIIGNVLEPPLPTRTKKGTAVCFLSLGTEEAWHDEAGQRQTTTQEHVVIAWGKAADLAASLKPGSVVYAQGSARVSPWEDQEGSKHQAAGVHVNDARFLILLNVPWSLDEDTRH